MSRVDILGYDGIAGDFAVQVSQRIVGRIVSYSPKGYRCEVPVFRGNVQRHGPAATDRWHDAYKRRAWADARPHAAFIARKTWHAEKCIVVPFPPGLGLSCSACKEPLVLWDWPQDPAWLCTRKHCGAMHPWLTPLPLLLPQLSWVDEVAA